MDEPKTEPTTIDEYIAKFPDDIQKRLQAMRETIHAAAPDATELLSYAMPTFRLNDRNLIYFSAAKQHIGIYPTPAVVEAFKDRLEGKADPGGKGTIQFPHDKPIPHDLLTEIVQYGVEQNIKKKKK